MTKPRILMMLVVACALATGASAQSVAEKIASIDGTSSESSIGHIRSLLEALSSRYQISESEVGDMTQAGKNALSERGIDESDTSILDAVNQLGMHGHTGHDLYAQVVTQYVLDRQHGYSQGESVRHLRMSFDDAADLVGHTQSHKHRTVHKKQVAKKKVTKKPVSKKQAVKKQSIKAQATNKPPVKL